MSNLPAAILRAKEKIGVARARAEELTVSSSFSRAHQAWRDFLISANGVFSMLEQGVKGNDAASAWFGKEKKTRKADPLLSYVHHARNADEHGVNSITGEDKPKIEFVARGAPQATLNDVVDKEDRIVGVLRTENDGSWVNPENITEIRIYPRWPSLIPVRDRGVTFNPPKEHLGKQLIDVHPHSVAQHMISYLERMIAEAESFLPPRV